MANALIDNSAQFKLVNYIKELVSRPDCNHIMIATGYWDLPGTALIFDELKDFFARGGKFDLLIGQEPQLQYYQASQEVRQFPDFYIQRDVEALTDDYKPVGKLILDNALTEDNPKGQFEIRVFGQGEIKKFLHAKCYIFLGNGLGTGIIGSSNFTAKGLQSNAELNYLEENSNCVTADFTQFSNTKSHKAWFEELWKNSELWTGKFIKNILKPSPIGVEIEKDNEAEKKLTPYEVFIKYLQLQFGDMLDGKTSEILKTYLPEAYSPLAYQLDAVKQGFSIMKRYGGFILGDVVGLGKTVVGLLLIRYFLENAESLGRQQKVLIVTPPSIRAGWINTLREFDKSSTLQIEPYVTFITTGSIDNILDIEEDADIDGDEFEEDLKIDNYGLILIDESHNFRNTGTQKYQALDDLIGSIYPTPYVCLLSATPQNNSPKDIYHQIRLFQRETNNTSLPGIEGGKLDSFFNQIEKRYREARNMPQDTPEQQAKARKIIAEVSDEVRKRVLNELVVRRTRTDIQKLYPADAASLKFPVIKGPEKLEYHMDSELQQLFYDTVNAICPRGSGETFNPSKHIGFFRYAAIAEFKDDKNKKLYEKRNLTVEGITQRLQRIMQILLVKRLESSMAAFKATLSNLYRYTEIMIDMLDHDCVFICPGINVNKIYQESKGDFTVFAQTVEKEIERKGGNNRRFNSSDFDPEYRKELENDRKLIHQLLDRWKENDFDPKLDRFKQAVDNKLFSPEINNPHGYDKPRLVIFTEALDTIRPLRRILESKGHKVLTVSSANRGGLQGKITANFDANVPDEDKRDDYDVLITTEVLAEGVNLHRSNVILNYDAPWNATRLMQRMGRVNRIGSREDEVYVFNFFPSDEGNGQIRLIEKAYAKLQSFHEMFGEDNKVFSDREELCEHDIQKYVDGEETPFGPYIRIMRKYHEDHHERSEYLLSLPAENLGGHIEADEKGAVFVFTDNSGAYISVKVPYDEESKPEIISTLATMEFLACRPDISFIDSKTPDEKLLASAWNAYNSHVTHYLVASDSSRKMTEASCVLRDLRSHTDVTEETKSLLKKVEKLVISKDNYIIKLVLKYKDYQPSLFGADEDINALLQASFANIARRAKEKRGEAHIAIFETK